MSTPMEFHREAMLLADEARQESGERALRLFRQALERERAAIAGLPHGASPRSLIVLTESAIHLALAAEEPSLAEQLAASVLTRGDCPETVRARFRDLFEQATFSHHLRSRDVQLTESEVQVTMSGGAIGHGFANVDEVFDRLDAARRLFYRTAERRQNKPYREQGRKKDALKERVDLFMSPPQAASFAITLRLGKPSQLELPGTEPFDVQVVDEVLACMELVQSGDEDGLRSRIPDDAYRRNFVALAGKIAPDGERVRQVAFASRRAASDRSVALTRTRASVRDFSVDADQPQAEEFLGTEELRGFLRYADATSSDSAAIKLKPESTGRAVTIEVPPGMMTDIVRPLWDELVMVELAVYKKGPKKRLRRLRRIWPASDEA